MHEPVSSIPQQTGVAKAGECAHSARARTVNVLAPTVEAAVVPGVEFLRILDWPDRERAREQPEMLVDALGVGFTDLAGAGGKSQFVELHRSVRCESVQKAGIESAALDVNALTSPHDQFHRVGLRREEFGERRPEYVRKRGERAHRRVRLACLEFGYGSRRDACEPSELGLRQLRSLASGAHAGTDDGADAWAAVLLSHASPSEIGRARSRFLLSDVG
jgi:hypothetical protein